MNHEAYDAIVEITQQVADDIGVHLEGGGAYSTALNAVRRVARARYMDGAHPDAPQLFEEAT